MPSFVHLHMFGGLVVQVGERTVTRFTTQKSAALLAYLGCFPQLHSRDILVDIYWPDSEVDAGRASLSQALSTLRRQLEPPGTAAGTVILSTKSHVGLNQKAISSDVNEFQAALRRARVGAPRADRLEALQEAAGLYRGELLPGFYEDWVQAEQQRLADLYFQAVDSLVNLLEESDDFLSAIEYARRAIAIDPLREESHQHVMRVLAASGNRADALNQYRELARILDEELGATPSSATRKLVQAIENVETGSPPAIRARRSKDASGLPRGTVTFLLTDIAGSTALWEKEGESFQIALENHHRLLRGLFVEHGGHEVKEAGDSFLVAFESPTAALSCAVAAQKQLNHIERVDLGEEREGSGEDSHVLPSSGASVPSAVRIAVRVALHTGEVKLENGEYHGLALHRAARVLTAAHGGQILASESLASIVRRDLPSGVSLVDLGVYRLRDVQAPERLFQVNYDGMAQTDFPRPNAEAGYQSNLPLQFTRFFGREEQMAQLGEMLQAGDTRLVTITGPGGTGKTRLALEVGNRLLEPFGGAVWFVPLVDLSDPTLISGAIVDSLRIPRSPTGDPLDQAAESLNRQPSLLILDNLEQFVEEGGKVVRALLERVASLTCLITSRQSLSLAGEREYQLAPLATPNPNDRTPEHRTPEHLTMFESVRLFVDRAQAVKPDFQVTTQNAPAVAELCDRLEGIPLAIELAAARASVLSPAQMLHQLENRFDFLVSRRRDAAERHRTLRAAIDWSYQLLPPPIQQFFANLSVFRGGWTPEAAEAVCNESEALDYLTVLCDASLVGTSESRRAMRFSMLESIRTFACEQLPSSQASRLQRNHLTYYGSTYRVLVRNDETAWADNLEADFDNVRAACTFCLKLDPNEVARLFPLRLGRFGYLRGRIGELRRVMRDALPALASELDPKRLVSVLEDTGMLAYLQADYEDAEHLFTEQLQAAEVSNYESAAAGALIRLAYAASGKGDLDRARMLTERSLAMFRKAGSAPSAGMALNFLGELSRTQGRYEEAAGFYQQSLAAVEPLGGHYALYARVNLGRLAIPSRDPAGAESWLREALEGLYPLNDWRGVAECLFVFAGIACLRQQYERAATLLGAGEALHESIQSAIDAHDKEDHDRDVALARAALGDRAYESARELGRHLSVSDAVNFALAL